MVAFGTGAGGIAVCHKTTGGIGKTKFRGMRNEIVPQIGN